MYVLETKSSFCFQVENYLESGMLIIEYNIFLCKV